MGAESFAKELATFERNKDNLASEEGRFVLIQGDEIAGVWDTYKDALEAGYGKYGLTPFLVKQVRGVEEVQFFTRDIFPCQS